MDQAAIGKFIAQCRKAKGLTQAQLAGQLHITDRAVSKWETGKSLPDASLMLELCAILGVTATELLRGARDAAPAPEPINPPEGPAEPAAQAVAPARRSVLPALLVSAALLTGCLVCCICDIALSGGFGWSRIVVLSAMLAWGVLLPPLVFRGRGLAGGLAALSALIFPYLFALSRLLRVQLVFSLGAPVAAASVLFLWGAFAVCHRVGRRSRQAAAGLCCLLAVPMVPLLNALVAHALPGHPVLDVFDFLSIAVLLALALLCLARASSRP